MTKYRLGVDVGGTFTDLALIDEHTSTVAVNKTLTTPQDPSEGIMIGTISLLESIGLLPTQVDIVVHGTTLATNALIERKGAKTGMITTKGFRDILELRRETRYDIYDLFIEMPEPVIPRELRLGVQERIDKDGRVIIELDENEFVNILRKLIEQNVESIAICFLHSYANPSHEIRAREIINQEAPWLSVTLSNEVAGAIREDERFSTASINAYIRPITEKYLSNLSEKMTSVGFKKSLFVMLSNGGLTTFDNAKKFPVKLIESGPAGGTMAAVFYSTLLKTPNLVAFDMGGTTAKISLVQDGKPATTLTFEAARQRRFMKGSGLPIMISAIDLMEIGAGGGSIGWVDSLGLLRVGPESAGAYPGPACYGLGGENPTVTDAALILGYLDPDYFLGGKMKLYMEKAVEAIKNKIGDPLGLDVTEAAWGIHRVVTENMAGAARIHILEKGKDPRRFSILAFGGAGPIHAWRVAKLVGSPRIVSPLAAGVMSALGFLVTPVTADFVQTYLTRLDHVNWDKANKILEDMEKVGKEQIIACGIKPEEIIINRTADMRYVKQGREISVPLPNGELSSESVKIIRESFETVYKELYSRYLTDTPLEIVNWRVKVSGLQPSVNLRKQKININDVSPFKKKRQVYFPEYNGFIDCPVFDRYLMDSGTTMVGPAIIEEKESTLVVGPGGKLHIDQYLNAIIDI